MNKFIVILVFGLTFTNLASCAWTKTKRAAILKYSNPLLPPNVITYDIDSSLGNSPVRLCVRNAMNHVENSSCVKFNSKSSKPVSKGGYLLFRENPNPWICHSQVGINTHSPTVISLGKQCGVRPKHCTKELLHALGMAYETERPEARNHVTLKDGHRTVKAEQFRIKDYQLFTPYDISSVMHHSQESTHGLKAESKSAILEKSVGMDLRGERRPLSHRDVAAINQLFRCAAPCQQKPKCQHGGFVNNKCKCVCPYAFSGKWCEKLKHRRKFKLPGCGIVKAKSSGYITSPKYPQRYPNGLFCEWLIETPKPWQKLEFKIEKLDLEHEELLPGEKCHDFLTIWQHGTDVATKFLSCLPEDIAQYTSQRHKTQYNWLLVEFRSSSWGQFNHSGFNISYKVIDDRPRLKDTAKKPQVATDGSVENLKSILNNKTKLHCYLCLNGKSCNESTEKMTKEYCELMEACSTKINALGEIEWRGCMMADRCIELKHEKCTNNSKSCTKCCGKELCNSASKFQFSVILSLLLIFLFKSG